VQHNISLRQLFVAAARLLLTLPARCPQAVRLDLLPVAFGRGDVGGDAAGLAARSEGQFVTLSLQT
jgi:hypothetical protein